MMFSCNYTNTSSPTTSDSTLYKSGPLPIPLKVNGTFSGDLPCDCQGILMSLTLADTSFTAVVNYKGLKVKGKSFAVIRGSALQDNGLMTLQNEQLPSSSFRIISLDSIEVLGKGKKDQKHFLVRGKRL